MTLSYAGRRTTRKQRASSGWQFGGGSHDYLNEPTPVGPVYGPGSVHLIQHSAPRTDLFALITGTAPQPDSTYEFWRSALNFSSARQHERTARFQSLREQWESETAFTASVMDRFVHGAYQQIIGMGPGVLGDILRALEESPDHWFWALSAISGEDAAVGTETFAEARDRWLEWGRERGHLR